MGLAGLGSVGPNDGGSGEDTKGRHPGWGPRLVA